MSNSLSLSNPSLPVTNSASPSEKEPFLRFHLEPDTTALLPLPQLAEVFNIPISQIVPIAHMPSWIRGVYNWRGEILWIADLGHLIGLTPSYQLGHSSLTYTTVVLQSLSHSATSTAVKNQLLGVIVNRLEDIEWCDLEQIQSPPASTVHQGLLPFLRGYWWKSDDDFLAVLDGEAIMAAMPKQGV
jgi:positive phototaxis protein PixI